MRSLIAAAVLLFAAPAAVSAADSAAIAQQAQAWLEPLDAGRYAPAWRRADAALQQGTDLARRSQAQIRARGSEAPTCREALDRQRRKTPARIETLCVTQFADGRRIAGKVSVSAAATPAVRAYRIGPPQTGPAARCEPAERRP